MKKTIQITRDQLQQIIKEGVAKLHKKALIENRIKQINEELNNISENSEVASPAMIDTINGYLEAALWTEEEELGPSNIETDVSFEAKVDAYTDIKKFKQLAGELIAQSGLDDEQIGHDLWLTRNGHGAGFWDRGLGEIGDKLADIARGMGSKYAYVGDDGLIYID